MKDFRFVLGQIFSMSHIHWLAECWPSPTAGGLAFVHDLLVICCRRLCFLNHTSRRENIIKNSCYVIGVFITSDVCYNYKIVCQLINSLFTLLYISINDKFIAYGQFL